MTFEKLEEMLKFAKALHKINHNLIDFSKEDQKHAIYILQGGILTACTKALEFNLKRYHMATTLHKRLIDEAIYLIWYFDDITDGSRHLRAWFRGEVVERKTGKDAELSIEERAKQNNSSPDLIESIDKYYKKFNNITSKYMHPTIEIMRANMLKRTYYFDYDISYATTSAYNVNDFGTFFVIPTLNAIRLPTKTLPLLNIDYTRLKNYIDEIEKS